MAYFVLVSRSFMRGAAALTCRIINDCLALLAVDDDVVDDPE
jgi:hypothetical protein